MGGKLETVRSDIGMPRILAILARDGAVIVEDLLSPDLLARMNAEFDAAIAGAAPGSKSRLVSRRMFHGDRTKRVCGLARFSPAFVELMQHPILLGWADDALRRNAGGYWMNTGQLMVIGPGEPAQYLHRDQDNWPMFSQMGRDAPECTVSVMVALSPFTEELGATRVVPGSHAWDDYGRKVDQSATIPAVMPAGAGLLYSGKVVHGAGHNRTTDLWRRGLHLSYVLGWLRPEEAHTLAVPWEVAKDLPPKARELLGYASYDPNPHYGGRLWLLDFDDARHVLADGDIPEEKIPEPAYP
ncbi:phytanoyl-CoA dioxygenase family protein [Zavarzinia sp. CC-PAN008]|uniref:phytanoyl-CoA dioxygenase family protein n=1 Tax=Zavarzinia sp. CC-PAN008 TaxID=3243332 RepID=UPI003F743046